MCVWMCAFISILISSTLISYLTLSQWQFSVYAVAIQCDWKLDPSVHWNPTGECGSIGIRVYFWLQWSSGVFQLCKLCKYHQPVCFHCSLSSGIPVYWQHLVWRSARQATSQHATPYVYNWNGESVFNCNINYTKTIMVLISKAWTEWCWSTHMFEEQNWYVLQSSKI